MSTHRAPKQWSLSKTETVNSFENWGQNLTYTLSLDNNFATFLDDGAVWDKRTKANPLRGFTDDGHSVPAARRLTAQQTVTFLELMLGQIANYCPVISRNTIVRNSTSIDSVWHTIRQHYGFQVTGAHFLDFADIRLEPNERPEDLFQRLMACLEDVLLQTNRISHHGEAMTEDEELKPTLENFIVLTWLRPVHPELPRLVKQRYGTELRSRTLASVKPEISQALSSLLDEIHATDEAKIMRTATSTALKGSKSRFYARPAKSCPLCFQAGRPSGHFLSSCTLLPDQDRRYMAKATQIVGILEDDCEDTPFECPHNSSDEVEDLPSKTAPAAFRIQTRQSPYMDTFHGHTPVRITIDSEPQVI